MQFNNLNHHPVECNIIKMVINHVLNFAARLHPRAGSGAMWSLTMWVVILCGSMYPVSGTLDKYCSITEPEQNTNNGICGIELSSILALLCKIQGYNKRSAPDIPIKMEDDKQHLPDESFLSRDDASTFLTTKRGKFDSIYGAVSLDGYFQQGIVCECCQHRCTMKELTQYCRYPSFSAFGASKKKRGHWLNMLTEPSLGVDDLVTDKRSFIESNIDDDMITETEPETEQQKLISRELDKIAEDQRSNGGEKEDDVTSLKLLQKLNGRAVKNKNINKARINGEPKILPIPPTEKNTH